MTPLYNCYWCRCAYCARMNYDERCKLSDCLDCLARAKKRMVPILRKSCPGFIEETIEPLPIRTATAEMCTVCIYRQLAREIEIWYFKTRH